MVRTVRVHGKAMGGLWIAIGVLVAAVGASVSCGDVNGALERQFEARNLGDDLLVEFTKASDASNRAVMADTDEASVASAREADQAKQAVQKDVDALGPILQALKYPDETRRLEEFVSRFAAYAALDRNILDIAVENTNLKAQRISFGPAQETADAFRDAAENLVSLAPAKDLWRAKAEVASAVSAVREIQALQAPHIADPDDASMTRTEHRMATADTAARTALAAVGTLAGPAAAARVASAVAILDKFVSLNAEVVALSRRNTNVRSLALSLNQKPTLTAACDESLRALQQALAKRGYPTGR